MVLQCGQVREAEGVAIEWEEEVPEMRERAGLYPQSKIYFKSQEVKP